jgi:uncharacterized protein (TIGR02118 family)
VNRRWVRLRAPGDPPASGTAACHAARRPKAGEPEAVELFDADPRLADAFPVEANALLDEPAAVVFVAVLRRRPDVDHAFFSRYWREEHARFGPLIPGVRRYVQLHAVDGAPIDGVCEVGFDSLEDLVAGLQADVIRIEARADEERFIDHSRSYGLVCGGDG